jgi:chromosome segregation ATPase
VIIMDDTLLPGDEMEKLRREIEILKQRQGISPRDDNDQRASMVALSKSINSLIRVFKEASDEMKMDTHDAVLVTQKLDKIVDRLEKIEIQNEKIAKGIVAIADMVEDLQAAPKQAPSTRTPPAMPYQQNVSQTPQPKPLPTYNVPQGEERKKSFLNFKM